MNQIWSIRLRPGAPITLRKSFKSSKGRTWTIKPDPDLAREHEWDQIKKNANRDGDGSNEQDLQQIREPRWKRTWRRRADSTTDPDLILESLESIFIDRKYLSHSNWLSAQKCLENDESSFRVCENSVWRKGKMWEKGCSQERAQYSGNEGFMVGAMALIQCWNSW